MARRIFFGVITAAGIAQFPWYVTTQYGLPNPLALFTAAVAAFTSILICDIYESNRSKTFPVRLTRFLVSPIAFVLLVHQGRIPWLDASVIASAVASYIFVCDPFNSIRAVARWAGERTAWYDFADSDETNALLAAITWYGFLILCVVFFVWRRTL